MSYFVGQTVVLHDCNTRAMNGKKAFVLGRKGKKYVLCIHPNSGRQNPDNWRIASVHMKNLKPRSHVPERPHVFHVPTEKAYWQVLQLNPNLVCTKFSGDWCPPSREIKPFVEGVASNNPGIVFVHIESPRGGDQMSNALSSVYNIRAVPTFMFMHQGEVITTGEVGRLLPNQGKLEGANKDTLRKCVAAAISEYPSPLQRSFKQGTEVMILNLQAAVMNGLIGTCGAYDAFKGRYYVYLKGTRETKSIFRDNLRESEMALSESFLRPFLIALGLPEKQAVGWFCDLLHTTDEINLVVDELRDTYKQEFVENEEEESSEAATISRPGFFRTISVADDPEKYGDFQVGMEVELFDLEDENALEYNDTIARLLKFVKRSGHSSDRWRMRFHDGKIGDVRVDNFTPRTEEMLD